MQPYNGGRIRFDAGDDGFNAKSYSDKTETTKSVANQINSLWSAVSDPSTLWIIKSEGQSMLDKIVRVAATSAICVCVCVKTSKALLVPRAIIILANLTEILLHEIPQQQQQHRRLQQ